MQITILDYDDDSAAKIVLAGKLDMEGVRAIEQPLTQLSGSKQGLVLDMSAVPFIASIGIRHLVLAAKTLARHQGVLVLLGPTEFVTEVLTMSGVDKLLPIVRSEDEARAMLAAPAR